MRDVRHASWKEMAKFAQDNLPNRVRELRVVDGPRLSASGRLQGLL